MSSYTDDDKKAVNTIRILAADMVQKAKAGHPGMPMGMAPVAHVLWSRLMHYNPASSHWWNRDRFLLSNGHGCCLQYALLHLAGYNLSTGRPQGASVRSTAKTPGHPEVNHTEGVEVTTGPLGQGIANAVGMALAESHLASIVQQGGIRAVQQLHLRLRRGRMHAGGGGQ